MFIQLYGVLMAAEPASSMANSIDTPTQTVGHKEYVLLAIRRKDKIRHFDVCGCAGSLL
jgi:hypothetical protein